MSLPVPTLPSTAGAFSLTSSNFSCTLPETVNSDIESRSFTNYIENLDGLDGGVKTRGTSIDPVNLQLSGAIMSSSLATGIRRVVAERVVTVTRGGLNLLCEVSSFSLKETVTGSFWQFSLSLVSYEGYWRGSLISATGNPASLANDGDLETYPEITATIGAGGASVVEVTVAGRTANYTGSMVDGDVLVLDTLRGEALLNGSSVLSNMNSAFFTNPIRVPVGTTSVAYNHTGTVTVGFTYTERHL